MKKFPIKLSFSQFPPSIYWDLKTGGFTDGKGNQLTFYTKSWHCPYYLWFRVYKKGNLAIGCSGKMVKDLIGIVLCHKGKCLWEIVLYKYGFILNGFSCVKIGLKSWGK